MNKLFFIFLAFISIVACENLSNEKLAINIPKEIKFLGHKGSGPIDENGNISLLENTWKSVVNAVDALDGSEIDIQLSADTTFWLFHDHEITNCDGDVVNVSLLSDEMLKEISRCAYGNQLITFSSFIDSAQTKDWENKIISLDLKLFYNPEALNRFDSAEDFGRFFIREFSSIAENSDLEILFEVPSLEFYNILKKEFNERVFLVNHNLSNEFLAKELMRNSNLSLPFDQLHLLNYVEDIRKQNVQ